MATMKQRLQQAEAEKRAKRKSKKKSEPLADRLTIAHPATDEDRLTVAKPASSGPRRPRITLTVEQAEALKSVLEYMNEGERLHLGDDNYAPGRVWQQAAKLMPLVGIEPVRPKQ